MLRCRYLQLLVLDMPMLCAGEPYLLNLPFYKLSIAPEPTTIFPRTRASLARHPQSHNLPIQPIAVRWLDCSMPFETVKLPVCTLPFLLNLLPMPKMIEKLRHSKGYTLDPILMSDASLVALN